MLANYSSNQVKHTIYEDGDKPKISLHRKKGPPPPALKTKIYRENDPQKEKQGSPKEEQKAFHMENGPP